VDQVPGDGIKRQARAAGALPEERDVGLLGAAASLGGVVYAAGLLAWRGGQALGLRILGWVLLVTALVIPSTLTLGLPLVALLVVALAPIPEQIARDTSAS
jgi:hypothetical protein